jgi:acyl carrier protein
MTTDRKAAAASSAAREEIVQEVKQITAQHAALAAEDIQERHTLEQDLGLDSLDRVEIVMEIEEAFDINVPDNMADNVRTVGDMVDGVVTLLSHGNVPT